GQLRVACVDGTLVEVDAAAGAITKTFHLQRDLRDVIVRGDRLLVTRFRSAQLLEVDPSDGRVLATRVPPDVNAASDLEVAAFGNAWRSIH
ncbi:MAG TPA: cytochrome-c peroxidase, partial [Polyangiales bacterium]|nr:cytochrome-c peroxidase [Polyangiales bacterium]